MLDALDADAVRTWSRLAAHELERHRLEIDALNVFPVADADTGTNLALTLRAAADGLAADRAETAGTALACYAEHAVLGALGNSGVIAAQLLRGLATAALGTVECDVDALRAGLKRGVDQAYAAVAEPVDGTMLTVARAAADAAPTGPSLGAALAAAVDAAAEALRRTPEQLPVLAAAGVVDAGGRGWLLVLQALAATVSGSPMAEPAPMSVSTGPSRSDVEVDTEHIAGLAPAFEVQYLLHADEAAVPPLRRELAALGDSLAVVGTGDGTWNVHVHTEHVGPAIEAGVAAGRPHRISVVPLGQTHVAKVEPRERPAPASTHGRIGTGAVVAIAPGDGLAHLFEREGVQVVDPDASGAVRADDVTAAIMAARAEEVVLLPNAERAVDAATAAARTARGHGVRVMVVPTRSPVQGLAAVAVHDPGRAFDDDVVAMAEAAAATRFAEITVAQAESLTSVGICQPGDVLGLIDGEVVEIGHGFLAVSFAVLDRLLGVGAELMTLVLGADAPAGVGEVLARHVSERAPLTDVSVYVGGQPRYPLIVGVE